MFRRPPVAHPLLREKGRDGIAGQVLDGPSLLFVPTFSHPMPLNHMRAIEVCRIATLDGIGIELQPCRYLLELLSEPTLSQMLLLAKGRLLKA
jgi:hypothetical protein